MPPQQGPDPRCAGCFENIQWKTEDTMKSSFQKEVKKKKERISTAMSLHPAIFMSMFLQLFCCGNSCYVGLRIHVSMEAPYFDTAGYSAPFGISGIRGGTPSMIDCLNEKKYDKNPLHEMRLLWMVTGSAHSPQRRIYFWSEILEVKDLGGKIL